MAAVPLSRLWLPSPTRPSGAGTEALGGTSPSVTAQSLPRASACCDAPMACPPPSPSIPGPKPVSRGRSTGQLLQIWTGLQRPSSCRPLPNHTDSNLASPVRAPKQPSTTPASPVSTKPNGNDIDILAQTLSELDDLGSSRNFRHDVRLQQVFGGLKSREHVLQARAASASSVLDDSSVWRLSFTEQRRLDPKGEGFVWSRADGLGSLATLTDDELRLVFCWLDLNSRAAVHSASRALYFFSRQPLPPLEPSVPGLKLQSGVPKLMAFSMPATPRQTLETLVEEANTYAIQIRQGHSDDNVLCGRGALPWDTLDAAGEAPSEYLPNVPPQLEGICAQPGTTASTAMQRDIQGSDETLFSVA